MFKFSKHHKEQTTIEQLLSIHVAYYTILIVGKNTIFCRDFLKNRITKGL